MKRSIFLTIILLSISIVMKAQNNGAITEDLLKQYRNNIQTEEFKALQNAISNNDIQKLALNRTELGKIDHQFSHVVTTRGITDQKSSGRCWLFTGLNVLKPVILEKYNLESFEFSQTYNFFFDQLEKSNLMLEGIIASLDKPFDDRTVEWFIKSNLSDGGQWTTFADIVTKYGVVPKSAMPESHHSESTRYMNKIIRNKLKEFTLELREMYENKKSIEEIRIRKEEMIGEVYRLLALFLGEPPTEFEWRYRDKNGKLSATKTYTPKSFYEQAFGIDLSEYVMIMNDPTREYYKLYEVEYDRNMVEGYNWKYVNLPAKEIKQFAKLSIMDNQAMYFSCDVGKQINKDNGTLDVNNYDYESLFGTEFKMDKADRINTFESASSHGMVLIGVDVDEKGITGNWLLENSWGAQSGHNGYLTMTDEWFDEYMFRVVIHKKFISDKVLKVLETEPIKLPPWDPMFMPED
jgi:bleomycin hydrolase